MTYIVVPSPGGAGSISLDDLLPIIDGSTPGPGQVGEIITATQAALSGTGIGATGTWGSITSITLTAGVWKIFGIAALAEGTAPLTQYVRAGISDSATGVGMLAFDFTQHSPFLVGSQIQVLTPTVRRSIASTTTFYLNSLFNYASGSPEHAGSIWALRYS